MTTDSAPGRFQLSLVENSLDFFLSAAEYAARDDPLSWKYSILHLADGVELLFKARLEREHWSLLFADINQASLEKLERGDFKSVDFEDTCRRLRQIALVEIDQRESEQLNELRRLRNKIRHYTTELNSRQLRGDILGVYVNLYSFLRIRRSIGHRGSPWEDKQRSRKGTRQEHRSGLGEDHAPVWTDMVMPRLLVTGGSFRQ